MRAAVWISFFSLALCACQSSDDGDDGSAGASGEGGTGGAGECDVTAPTACPNDAPTFADVEPILEERCVVCHAGSGQGPCPTCWGLVGYSHVKSWAPEIRNQMLECAMPPAGSGFTMTRDERVKILEWIRCGAPE